MKGERSALYGGFVTNFDSVAPVLPTVHVLAALRRYERLGFEVSAYDHGDQDGYVRRGDVWLHLSRVRECRS
jgi:hypothetical protein